jgi:S-adenosylmethionine decarboxylase proenzyme
MRTGLGLRLEIELEECGDEALLDDPVRIEGVVRKLVEALGAQLLHIQSHHFHPLGVSCVSIMSASDIAVHTWPECRFASVHIFTCVCDILEAAIVRLLETTFQANPARTKCRSLVLGEGLHSPFFDALDQHVPPLGGRDRGTESLIMCYNSY